MINHEIWTLNIFKFEYEASPKNWIVFNIFNVLNGGYEVEPKASLSF